jgi:hypothetical protein
MPKIFALAALLFPAALLSPHALSAQFVAAISTQQCVWHTGDNPSWATPQLDESSWQPYSNWKANTAQPHLWVRCHVSLGLLHSVAQPAIQVSLYSAYQLYLNGTLLGTEGNLSSGNASLNAVRSYPVPQQLLNANPESGISTLAVRIIDRTLISNSGPMISLINSRLQLNAGDASLLDALRARTVLARASDRARAAIYFSFVGVIALMMLGLYFFYDRSRSEFLLLSVACLSLAMLRINEFAAASLLNYSISTCLALVVAGNIALTVTQVPFFYAVARRRVPLFIVALLVAVSLAYFPSAIDTFLASKQPADLSPLNSRFLRPFELIAHMLLSFVPFVAFWPFGTIPRRIRPLAALCMLWGAVDAVWFGVETTGLSIPGLPNLFAHWGLFLLSARGITTACVLAALFALLFREQRQMTEERALFAGEVQAARDVQQYLIPAHLPATPGFTIASEYRPSREVGGDFFQILPHVSDGSLLLVIGDVAGKGIEAGMLATLIVGAVRTAASFTSDPARILALLNERLIGRGLVTCLALHIDQEGAATLVNAGHLPPYLNGKELPVDGSLPLGAVTGLHFPALHFTLAPGDSLLLMTDGVVEAQNTHGQLFGFDRIAELLRTGADAPALASAAEAFGQQDDITVLTLGYAPVEVAHA